MKQTARKKYNLKTTTITKGLLAASLGLFLTTMALAQDLPPAPTNTPTGLTPEQIAAAQAALAAAEVAYFSNNFASYAIQDVGVTSDDLQAQITTNLLTLATVISNAQTAQQVAVATYISASPIVIGQSWTDTNGNLYYFDHLDEAGDPAIKVTHNLESAQTVGAQRLWPGGSSGFGLNGTNVLMAQWDGGDVLTNHQEFTNGNRVYLLDGPSHYGVQDHPTHVAGTMTAWGVSTNAVGFANRGRVVESIYDVDLSEMPQVAANLKVRESNHSYGYTGGWGIILVGGNYYWIWYGDIVVSTNQDWHFGFYNGVAQTNDQIIYTAQNYLPVFSSGNENGPGQHGPDTQPIGHYEMSNGVVVVDYTHVRPLNDAQSGFNTLTAYGVSKNNLVVGAVGANTNGYTGTNAVSIAVFSSLGPTADGRIKPDLVADGVNVYSCFSESNSAYAPDSGTSMSAPAVTGSLGLLTQLYNQLYGTNNPPLSSTLRGIMIHTADQLGINAGPSYTYGWGLIDPLAAANLATNNFKSGSLAFVKEVRLVNGDRIEFPVKLTNGVPFRATITWTDPPGTPTGVAVNPTNHMLVNDLDLRVVSPNGTTNLPYVLNPASPASAATTADNAVDNVEQVYIPSPTNGTYTVRVTHKGTVKNDQGQTSYQNVSIMLSGNVAQPPILPVITQIYPITTSNTIALAWSSDVGRIYKVQSENGISSSSWQYATAELSASKTNTAITLPFAKTNNVFYRIVQVR